MTKETDGILSIAEKKNKTILNSLAFLRESGETIDNLGKFFYQLASRISDQGGSENCLGYFISNLENKSSQDSLNEIARIFVEWEKNNVKPSK